MVRAHVSDIAGLSREATEAVTRVNPNLATTVRPFSEIVTAALSQERLVARLGSFFGLLALFLAALGLYGVTAYSVTPRYTEMGIRLALGTTPAALVRLVLSRVAVLVAFGVAIGAVIAWWATPFTKALLYDVGPHDLPTIGAAVLVLVVVAGASAWLPARRAAQIDPAAVLRDG